jgi:hypothetical protein
MRFLAICAFELVMLAATIAGSFALSDAIGAAMAPTVHVLSQATP